jgi:hypothetical protein
MHGEFLFHAAWSEELAVSYKEFEKSEKEWKIRTQKIIVSEL